MPRMSAPTDYCRVVVQRDWNGWRTATVRVKDLEDVHWFRPSGAPHHMLHAHVNCQQILSGDVPHECHLSPGPHDLLVCILKRHAAASVFAELAHKADEESRRNRPALID